MIKSENYWRIIVERGFDGKPDVINLRIRDVDIKKNIILSLESAKELVTQIERAINSEPPPSTAQKALKWIKHRLRLKKTS